MNKDTKESSQSVSEDLAETNAKLEAELRKLKRDILKTADSTEMAKMQAQLAVLCGKQDRQTYLENEYADRKALYNKNVAKRKAKEAAIAKAVDDIENEIESKPSEVEAKSSEQASKEAKSFHDQNKVTSDELGQSLRPPGQGKGPSVKGTDSAPSGRTDKPSDS